jgi:hypothetical protein
MLQEITHGQMEALGQQSIVIPPFFGNLDLTARSKTKKKELYPKGAESPYSCDGCFSSGRICYLVAKDSVKVCWDCAVTSRGCSNSKRNQGMCIKSLAGPTNGIIQEDCI